MKPWTLKATCNGRKMWKHKNKSIDQNQQMVTIEALKHIPS